MVEIYKPPASIECKTAAIKTRKLVPHIPEHNDILNCLLFKCQCERNSEAEIVKELNPKNAKLNSNSMLDKGDCIKGEIISVLSKKPVKQDDANVTRGSASHKVSSITAKKYVYAELEKAFSTVEKA